MRESIANFLVQDRLEGEDTDTLHRKLFEVHMRLFSVNPEYKHFIETILGFMRGMFSRAFSDYTTLKGLSGANIGVPYNIVAAYINNPKGLPEDLKKQPFPYIFFLLNPKVVRASRKTITTQSNCGSIRLEKSISVARPEWVEVEYYDVEGKKHSYVFKPPISGTLQHEIEHNQGILITDKET